MKHILEDMLETAFIVIVLVCSVMIVSLICIAIYKEVFPADTRQPTVKCTDGKLYDVSYEGNITLYEKRPFTTCEER